MPTPKGYKHTPEARANMSAAHLGVKKSSETRTKMSIAKSGLKHSPEHIAKNAAAKRGEKNPNWVGGRRRAGGYVFLLRPNHPFATKSGYVLEHRLVMEAHIGRVLLPSEVVHHVNGNTEDNRIENLMLFSSSADHNHYHKAERKISKGELKK